MSLHEFLLRDPDCEQLAEGAMHAVSPLLDDPDPSPCLGVLEHWADRLAGRMPLPWDTLEALEAVNDYLFRHVGLRGDRESYEDPRNAVLPLVISRRRGLPISLSIIWIDVARRLGLDAVGIGLPGHFLAGLRSNEGLLCIDPFHGGRAVGEEEAADLVSRATSDRVTFKPEMLKPTTHRAIITRLVRNLHLRFVKTEAWEEALWTSTHLQLLDPDDSLPYKERGIVHLKRGEAIKALNDFRAALDRSNGSDPELVKWLEKLEGE